MAVEAETTQPSSIFAATLRSTSIGLLILITLIAFEAMAVSAALPTAARELHGLAAYGWAFTGFLIANVVGMVASGGLSDSRGPRLPLAAGLLTFLGGLVIAGSATTMAQLVAGRVVQGFGGGLLITAVYVVIGDVYPAALRPRLFAATSSAWVVPSAVGPSVSGLLTQHASWRWVFLGLVPFVVFGGWLMLPALRSLRSHDADPARRAVYRRRLWHAFAVALGIAALENAGQHLTAASAALAVPGTAITVWGLRELLPAGTFAIRPGVSAPIALRGVCAGAFFGIEATVPLSLTVQHGYSATAAGLPLTCAGFSWAIGSWWQGRVRAHEDDLRHRQWLLRTGFLFISGAAVVVALADQPRLGGWLMYVAWLLAGFGAGFAMSTVSVQMLAFTTDTDRGTDSAALQLSDATASAITTGVAGVLLAAAARGSIGYTSAFTAIAIAMGGVALLGAAAARRVRPAGT